MKQKPKTSPKNPFLLSQIIGVYQLAGGLLGLGLFLKLIPGLQNPSTSTWVGILLAALLYSFSIFCGFSLMRGKRQGHSLSLINQVLQVFSFGMGGLAYNYVAGLKIGVGIDFLASWLFKFRFSLSSFHFSLGTNTGVSFVAVNLLALLLIYLLERAREESKLK
ncbi:hypothetical protein [Rufibacter latericius]|uniref:Uncharacterized protein n=1 Tax=Rufibacter latericius TaxID=2487040 RepID=A0A3M9M8M4_9BACT|nr:hypothetical protein [Rufibacter latericius]RNI21901.1 hypothetical protein EFB08_22415 [Rufibacter latericius]